MPGITQRPELYMVPTTTRTYSLSFVAGKIPVLSRMILQNLNSFETGALKITVFGECSEGTFVEPVDIIFENFSPRGYGFVDDGSAIVEFTFEEIPVNLDFFTSLEESCEGILTIRTEFCGVVAVCEEKMILEPFAVWNGINETPEQIAAFVTPNHREIERILKGIAPTKKGKSIEENRSAAGELYHALQNQNLIYMRPEANFAEKGQKIKLADNIFLRNSRSMYPIDLAVLFCSCAEFLNLSPVLCFFKGESGASHVFCGIWLCENPVKTAVFESIPQLFEALERGDLLLIDPASYTAAHNTDFIQSCKGAYLQITKGMHTLICVVDIQNCRLCDVSPMKIYGTVPEIDFAGYDSDHTENTNDKVKKELEDAEKELLASEDNLVLSNFMESDNLRIPLLFPDLYAIEKDEYFEKKALKSCPSALSLSAIAPCAENFCSMYLPKTDFSSISQAEKTGASENLTNAKKILSKKDSLFTAQNAEEFELAQKDLFFTKDGTLYFAAGFLRTKTGSTEIYSPLVLFPATIIRENDRIFAARTSDGPTVNRLLLGKLLKLAGISSDEYIEEKLPTTLKEIFTLFENISAILTKENKIKRDVIREVYLVELNLQDYYLWIDLLQRREQMKRSPAVRAIAAESPELSSIGKRTEIYDFFQPLFADGSQKSALNIDGSFLLEGPRGSGKMQVCANIAAKEAFYGSSVLAVSEDKNTLSRFEKRIASIGISDLCLCLYGEKALHRTVFHEVKTALSELEKRTSFPIDESEYTLKKIKDEIYAYEYALHKKYSFGFSLYEAINAYEQALLGINQDNTALLAYDGVDFGTFDAENFEALFTLMNSLIASARNANSACGKLKAVPLCANPFFQTTPPENSADTEKIKENIISAKRKILLIGNTMKDLLPSVCIQLKDLCTFSNAVAANSLIQLALSSKDLEIPDALFESDISVFVERISSLKSILVRLDKIEKTLNFLTPEIYTIDIDFFDDGDLYENKNFLQRFIVRKNVAEQLSEYLIQEKKNAFAQKSTGEILRLLSEHKTLTQALKETGGEVTADTERFYNIVKISDFAEKANTLFNAVCEFDSRDRQEKLQGIIRFAASLRENTKLAEKAALSCVYFSELENTLQKLKQQIGLDLSNHIYSDGIFFENGINDRLDGIENNFSAFDKWNIWLYHKKKAEEKGLFAFCEYIERNGAGKNIEQLFSASVFSPVINYILSVDDTCVAENSAPISDEEYYRLLQKESKKSINKLQFAYAKELDEYLQTDEGITEKNALEVAVNNDTLEICELFAKGATLIQKLFPILIADNLSLAKNIGKSMKFDTALILQAQKMKKSRAYSALSVSDRPVFVCEPLGKLPIVKSVIENLSSLSLTKINLSNIFTETNGDIYSFVNHFCFQNALSCFCKRSKVSVEYLLIDGRFDRTGTRINEKEAESAVKIAVEQLLSGKYPKIAVIAFTTAQKLHIKNLLYSKAQNDNDLKEALKTGALCVKNSYEIEGQSFDAVVLSMTCGKDYSGRMCFNFGEPNELFGGLSGVPRALYSTIGAAKQKLFCLAGFTPEDILQTNNRSCAANAICSFLYFCRDRKIAIKKNAYQNETATDFILSSIKTALSEKKLNAVISTGISNFGMDIEVIPQTGSSAPVAMILDRESFGGIYEKLLYERELRLSGYRVCRVRSARYWQDREETIHKIYDFYCGK